MPPVNRPRSGSTDDGDDALAALLASLGLRDDVRPDADGSFGGLNLPEAHYTLLWRLSWLSLLAGVFALARGHGLELAAVPLSVGATSLLYWCSPDNSWRRTLDIVVVQCALWCAYFVAGVVVGGSYIVAGIVVGGYGSRTAATESLTP